MSSSLSYSLSLVHTHTPLLATHLLLSHLPSLTPATVSVFYLAQTSGGNVCPTDDVTIIQFQSAFATIEIELVPVFDVWQSGTVIGSKVKAP